MVQLNFDASQHNIRYGSDGGGLPPGRHKVIIEKSEIVPTRDNPNNQMLKLTHKCIEGLAQGGYQTNNLNLFHSSQETVRIAGEQLAAYCFAVGKPGARINTSEELHNIPFFIEVRNQRNNPEYTEICKLYNLAGEEAGKTQVAAAQAQPQPQQQWQQPAQPAPQQQWQQPMQEPQPMPQQPQQQWGPQPAAAPAAPWSPSGGGTAPGWGQR